MTDISAILTAHREGPLAGISFRSLLAAVHRAEATGISTEILVVLDRPDEATQMVFADAEAEGWAITTTDLADQGMVRNHAVEQCRGRYLAFLDGDDLWSENWLVAGFQMCESDPGRVIAHPEVNWFFGVNNNLFFHVDQTEPQFDPHFLRVGNYWDALCVAPREAYSEHPFAERAVADGFAYEDWHWNLETLDAAVVHRVVPDTLHFQRRRAGSQTMLASGSKCMPRLHAVQTWAWAEAHEAGRR